MTKDDIHLLFEYDRWANRAVLQAASTLTPENFTRDLGGSFPSVRDTLLHIISSEWAWLTVWNHPSPTSAFVTTEVWTQRAALFPPNSFPDVPALRSKWTEVEKEQLAFVNRVTNDSLRRTLPIRTTQITLALLMQHLANHSTYHRGQISLMMRQLAAAPVSTDFALFLLEARPDPPEAT